ncbi:hypothetical protein TIFTF001_008188 [Ficus carica]|uniref:NAC domain-containing protein n=1 Tax=Ficus carica TaxID=3494 RepID=A0AA88D1J0_FICCA|nr:hypothetical protein TIFTF001_008188 [Ficus carica]
MYFFTKNKPKHENGSRPTRKVRDGFWRASTNMIIQDDNGHKIGRKMLLNYRVNTDKKRNTDWLMYEYTISSNSDKMDQHVLCKVYKKSKTDEEQEKQDPQFNVEPNHAANLEEQNLDKEDNQRQDISDDIQDLVRQIEQSMEVQDDQNGEPQQQDPAYESASAHVGLENQDVEEPADLFTDEELAMTEGVYAATLMEDELNIQPDFANFGAELDLELGVFP